MPDHPAIVNPEHVQSSSSQKSLLNNENVDLYVILWVREHFGVS